MTNTVIDEIAAERARQVSEEGWSTEHDDYHQQGEMAEAAAAYAWFSAFPELNRKRVNIEDESHSAWFLRRIWPEQWERYWFKPSTPRRDLVKAAALIVAEIERLDRAALSTPESPPMTSHTDLTERLRKAADQAGIILTDPPRPTEAKALLDEAAQAIEELRSKLNHEAHVSDLRAKERDRAEAEVTRLRDALNLAREWLPCVEGHLRDGANFKRDLAAIDRATEPSHGGTA